MTRLSIDIETYSSVDLGASGVYAYSAAPDFEILICSYQLDDGPLVTLEGEDEILLDSDFLYHLVDPETTKTAWNANFERVCLGRLLGKTLDAREWSCSMVLAQYLGLPASLAAAGAVLKADETKDFAGKALINYFSKPCRPTKANGERTRNLPSDNPDKWQQFVAYNAQDVRTELAIRKKLDCYKLPEQEQEIYALDQRINDRGILLDLGLVQEAILFDDDFTKKTLDEARALSGLDNPNSVSQLKDWIFEEEGFRPDSLSKKELPDVISRVKNPKVKKMLELRPLLSKTSVAKYKAMEACACPDGRARGLLRYYGASRTGRWAGRLVQVQNLPRNSMAGLDTVRALLKDGDFESLELIYSNPSDVLSQLVRTAFIPMDGCRFVVADYSAIEARVLAWLADETWRIDLFKQGGDIYCQSATQMFGVPVVKHGINGELRQKGKIAELACGYGGAVGALKAMGGIEMGLTETELSEIVGQWRNANHKIVEFWTLVEEAAKSAIRAKHTIDVTKGLSMSFDRGYLFINLPSGRRLAYANARIDTGRFGQEAVIYKEQHQTTRQWADKETYGGKLTENIVQAIARDALALAMLRLDKAGFKIVMHIHDEVVLEVPKANDTALDLACDIMALPIPWAPGLYLTADGFECPYYQKD